MPRPEEHRLERRRRLACDLAGKESQQEVAAVLDRWHGQQRHSDHQACISIHGMFSFLATATTRDKGVS
jgi:hypothetical protein